MTDKNAANYILYPLKKEHFIMYIDFHTHAFADPIAEKAISKLENTLVESGYGADVPAATRGTVGELIEKLPQWEIDKAVILPIATKPSQQTTINNWAKDVQTAYSGTLYCFGSVHPDAEDAFPELERIKALGLHGVKLHPDYQGFFASEERLFPLYRKCAELGLPVVLHAGLDAASLDCIHCTPQMSAAVIDAVPELTLILAHLGGNGIWDDVEKYLVGRNVYLDTAYIEGNISDEQALRIFRSHGSDRILFASDCPWHPSCRERRMLERLPLSDKERELISHVNAEKLLNIC